MDNRDTADDFDSITAGVQIEPFTKMLADFSDPEKWPDKLPGEPA